MTKRFYQVNTSKIVLRVEGITPEIPHETQVALILLSCHPSSFRIHQDSDTLQARIGALPLLNGLERDQKKINQKSCTLTVIDSLFTRIIHTIPHGPTTISNSWRQYHTEPLKSSARHRDVWPEILRDWKWIPRVFQHQSTTVFSWRLQDRWDHQQCALTNWDEWRFSIFSAAKRKKHESVSKPPFTLVCLTGRIRK